MLLIKIKTGLLISSLFFFILFGCLGKSTSSGIRTYQASLIKKNDSLYYIQITGHSTTDRWELPYPVYQFVTGDVDNNGSEDILVGVIKTTRFDSVYRKRLFIFKNYDGYVRPLWLGSRLGQPLEDFTYVETAMVGYIRSIEKEKSGMYLVAEYKWRKFGLEFTRYLKRETDLKTAKKLLKS